MTVLALWRRLRACFYAALAVAGVAALAGVVLFYVVLRDLPRLPEPLSRIIETPATEIYAANGERLLSLGGRQYVPLHRVSRSFVQAILATEDHRFWDHRGVDKLRTFKALWVTFFERGRVQGASTITQQLAKNLFFSFEQTWSRKFRELLVALQIEAQFTKEEILEAYINQIPFGVGAYGIERAAETFFAKPASALNLAESALLAGLPKSPTRYNPFRHFERAKARQKVVLQRLVAVGAISPEEARQAAEVPLELSDRHPNRLRGSYPIVLVLQRLEQRFGAEVVYHGGLKVTTTLDPHLQQLAEAAVKEELGGLEAKLKKAPDTAEAPDNHLQGALVAVEAHSGGIKAMVGGRDYAETEFNRAVHSRRQPGSGFKPFLYYAAFETLGLNPASVFEDRAVRIPVKGKPDWRPRNFEREYHGPMVLKQAFTESVNTIAAQLVAQVGAEAVVDVARRCGIQSPLKPVYSVALGTSGVSPLEMAAGFATFATGGIRYEPFIIWRVEDAFGRVLEEHIVERERVLDPEICYQVVDMMRGVIDHGTAKQIRQMGFDREAAGKTGTTNSYRDAWFTGFTANLSTAVWVGYDRNRSMRTKSGVGVTGSRGAAPIWTRFMKAATAGEPPRRFAKPSGIEVISVNPYTGRKAGFFSRERLRVAMRAQQEGG
ncbi:MAG: PBP1A family penicillin-binding protein [Desulfosarcinaceae bacterium]